MRADEGWRRGVGPSCQGDRWPRSGFPIDNGVYLISHSSYFLADSHIVKVGEVKHSFLASELATAADEAGFLRSGFYSNFHFQDLADADLSRRQGTWQFAIVS
jgi:hypothetical protein